MLKDQLSAASPLLNDLYEDATAPNQQWLDFLEKFAALFNANTATLRLTDLDEPVVHHSYTIGLQQKTNQFYETEAVKFDPFRKHLAESPLGQAIQSPAIISDRDFERSADYQSVFRPNGNFYAVGTQFAREGGQAMHIGVHRPKAKGEFTREELDLVGLFSPHLKRAVGLSHMISTLNQALTDPHHALDQLSFGVWQMDSRLRVQWMNTSAEEALSTNTYGLALRLEPLTVTIFSQSSYRRDLKPTWVRR